MPHSTVLLEDLHWITENGVCWEKLRGASVLISGANGLIASYIVRSLLLLNDERQFGITVWGLARSEERMRARFGELLDRPDFRLLLQDVTIPVAFDGHIDYVIHAASHTSPEQFVNDPVGTALGNVLGVENLLSFAVEHGAKGFLLLSTREIYGKGQLDFVSENDYGITDPTQVRSCYPESKRMAENLCACYRRQYGLDCRIVRIAHTYGPGMKLSDGRVVGDFMGALVDGRDIVMNSDGSGTLALTYISDVIRGIFMAVCDFPDMVYNISNDSDPITVKQLAETICGLFTEKSIGLTIEIPNGCAPSGYLTYKLGFLCSKKARSEGWEPKIGLQEGLRRTARSFWEGDATN